MPPDPPPKPRKRRRIFRTLFLVLLGSLALVLALTVGLLLTVKHWLPEAKVREIAARELGELLGAEVRIGHLSLDLLHGVTIDSFCVGPPPGFTRDVLCVRRVDLAYDLSRERVVIHRALIESPKIVLETVGGIRNVDAILRHLGPSAPEEPEEPEPAEPGPLFDPEQPVLPLTVLAERVGIEDLGLELVGEGPILSAGGLSLILTASISPERAAARLKLARPTGAAITLRSPQAEIDTNLDLSLELGITAATARGLKAERAELSLALGLDPQRLALPMPLPAEPLRLQAELGLNLAEDRAELSRLQLFHRERSLLVMALSIDGVARALDAAGIAPALLHDLVGLTATGPGVLALVGPSLDVDLGQLGPVLAAFVPGLSASGRVTLAVEHLEGTLPELLARAPRIMNVGLGLEKLSARWPAQGLSISPIDGQLRAQRSQGPLLLRGQFAGGRASMDKNSVERLAIGLSGAVAALDYPALGASSVTVSVDLAGVRAGGAQVAQLGLQAGLSGLDVLAAARPEDQPIKARTRLKVERARIGTGTSAISLGSLALGLDAELDRLLEAARRPIHAKLSLDAKTLQAGALQAQDLRLSLDATSGDPRAQKPFDAKAELLLRSAGLIASGTKLAQVELGTTLSAGRVDLSAPPTTMASDAKVALRLEVGDVELDLGSAGTLHAPLGLEVVVHARPAEAKAELEKLRVRLADLITLQGSGTSRELWSAAPLFDVRVELEPTDLAKLSARPEIKALGTLRSASGALALSARAKGRWLGVERLLASIEDPPVSVDLSVAASHVHAALAELELADLDGRIDFGLTRGKLELSSDLKLASYQDRERRAEGLEVSLGAGKKDGLWTVTSAMGLGRLLSLSTQRAALDRSRFVLDAVFAPYGDVQIRRLFLSAPAAGVALNAKGRLERRRFGALRPVLSSDLDVDLNKLRSTLAVLAPEQAAAVAGLSGALALHLGLASPSDQEISFDGALSLKRVSYSAPGLSVEGASGRLPVSQSVVIPAPDDALLTAIDRQDPVLGPFTELEARLAELTGTILREARPLADESDVLVKAPRTADYEALRPYYTQAAGLTVDKLVYGTQTIEAIAMDIAYASGLIRLDRFAMRVWGGDVFGDLALQIAGPGQIKSRLRATITDLNLDDPVADALGRARETDPGVRSNYLASGNLDLRVDLRDRTLNGYLDLTKIGQALLVRLIDSLDPKGEDSQLQETRGQLNTYAGTLAGTVAGVRLKGVVVSIRQNLMALDFVWDRTWVPFPRVWLLVTQPILGTVVTGSLAPIRRYSLSSVLDRPWVRKLNDSIFVGVLGGREILVRRREELEL